MKLVVVCRNFVKAPKKPQLFKNIVVVANIPCLNTNILSTCVLVAYIRFSALTQIISPDGISQLVVLIDIWCFLCSVNQFI